MKREILAGLAVLLLVGFAVAALFLAAGDIKQQVRHRHMHQHSILHSHEALE